MTRTLFALLALVAVSGCKRRQPPPPAYAAPVEQVNVDDPTRPAAPEPIEPARPIDREFWSWFAAHAAEVATIRHGGEPIAVELAARLHRVDPRLTFEVPARTTSHELVVSADGVKAAFPVVKRLVAAAPALPGWKVIAFRQRKPTVTEIELGDGTRVEGAKVSFEVLPSSHHGGAVDLAFFVPGITGSDLDGDMKVRHAMYLLLDAALGEHDVETRLGGVLFEPAGNASGSARPFRDLVDVVDHWK